MLSDYIAEYAKFKILGSRTIEQLDEEALNAIPAAEANSIGMIVRHLHGNLLSRFTDLLTTDGEKPWRDRKSEFAPTIYTKTETLEYWNAAWAHLEETLLQLSDEDLSKTITIRAEAMTVDRALCRSVAHASYHVGQIVLLGRMAKGANWTSLSIPRG
jgi:uncharacterized damage-inducible protein DinB